jgi:uncharacterized glyoxalase superfamily protein PhnB
MLRQAIPILNVAAIAPAEAFYCGQLGFRRLFRYAPFGGTDPCFMGVERDGVRLNVSSFSGDGIPGTAVSLETDEVDSLHGELVSRGVSIEMAPADQSWGARELYVRDPDGNQLRFQQRIGSEDAAA